MAGTPEIDSAQRGHFLMAALRRKRTTVAEHASIRHAENIGGLTRQYLPLAVTLNLWIGNRNS